MTSSEVDSGYYHTQMERRDWSDSFVYVTRCYVEHICYILRSPNTTKYHTLYGIFMPSMSSFTSLVPIGNIDQEVIVRSVENGRGVSTQLACYRHRGYQPVRLEMCQHHR